jgi:hypothetical protein
MALARIDGSVFDNVPRPVPGASIAVLTQPANTSTQPGSPLASIFADVNGSVPLANPFNADGSGNYFFYVAAGTYTIQIYGGTLASQVVLADQSAGTPAAGVLLKTNGTNNSSQTTLNLAQGAGVTLTEAAGTVTVTAAAAAIVFQTNGTNNGSQTTLNLKQGSGITLSNSGADVTISAAAAPVFQTNGTNNTSQSTLNLQSGANITISNPSAGNVSIAAVLPAFQANATPLASATTVNYQNGANMAITNPSAGNVKFDVVNVPVRAAAADYTSQTAAIAITTLYTLGASEQGQFVLYWDAKVTTAAATSSTLGALTVTYTDPDGVVQTITAPATSSAGVIETSDSGNLTTTVMVGMPLALNAKNSTNIQYAFAYASNPANAMAYNLHLRLVRLPD